MCYLLNVDILKAIGMLFVIAGHAFGYKNDFSLYIHAFHVPIFFFVSGYLFHLYKAKKFCLSKFKRLILPYLGYGLANFLICILIIKNFDIMKYIKSFCLYNNEPSIPVAGALWFLTALFFANVLFFISIRILKKYAIILIVLIATLEMCCKIKLPYSLDTAVCMLPIMYAGYLFKEFDSKFKLTNIQNFLVAFVLLVIISFTIFLNGDVNTRTNVYLNPYLFYFNAIFASIGYFYLSKIIEVIKYSNILALIGKFSLEYMCIHQVIMYFIRVNLHLTQKTLLFISTIVVTAVFVYIIQRIKVVIQKWTNK